jgi:hypothetical protein
VFAGAKMRDDRALERRALREIVYVRREAMEYESEHIRVAVVAISGQRESALETHDVRLGRQIVGELRIEQPRVADPKAGRRLRE